MANIGSLVSDAGGTARTVLLVRRWPGRTLVKSLHKDLLNDKIFLQSTSRNSRDL
jgi:hypothetical protein